jgi:O-antigen/teichoic acid export membrane protein
MFVLRGAVLRVLGLVGNIVLARLLVPEDFGAAAISLTVLGVAAAIADGGLVVGLVRRSEPPTQNELRAAVAFQLAVAALLLSVSAALVPITGRVGALTTTMLLALLAMPWRTPAVVLLERDLDFRRIVAVEVIQSVTLYLVAVPVALLGAGAWSFGLGVPTATAVASLFLLMTGPARLGPRLSFRALRPLIGAGSQYQLVGLVMTGRDLAVNLVVLHMLGPTALGIWSLAFRLVMIPALLFEGMLRISYSAVSRLRDAGGDAAPGLATAAGLVGWALAVPFAVIVAAAPDGVPLALGSQWTDISTVVPLAALGLMIAGPASTILAGFVISERGPRDLLGATIVSSALWITATAALAPVMGTAAAGVGWAAASLSLTLMLCIAVGRRTGTLFLRSMIQPLLVFVVGASAGWLVARAVADHLLGAVASGTVAGVITLSAIAVKPRLRRQIRDLLGSIRAQPERQVTDDAP